MPTGSVKQATRRGKRRSCKQVLLKERAECFYWWPIQGRKKPGQSGAMRQPISAKQGHERRGPRSQPFVKCLESWLTGKGIANQHSGKIDQIVLTKAGRAKRTCSWMIFSTPVCMSTRAKVAPSPIQEGMAGFDSGVIWMVTAAGVVSRIDLLSLCPQCVA
jgi:hypothetical protein